MDMPTEHEAIVRSLALPPAYPHRPDRVEEVETHISRVFLAGEYVYKLKKPINYEFLDFSTLAAREHACRDEVRLNRRFAPNTYLGVMPVIHAPCGAYQLEGPGQIVDWVVEMRRLSTELTLDSLHRRGKLRPEHIDRLAETLVRFYLSLTSLPLTPP